MSNTNSTVTYKDIPGFPGHRVGSDGSVWSCRERKFPGGGGCRSVVGGTWRRLRLRPRKYGHLEVKLHNGSGITFIRQVHRLVLESFVGPCPDGMECCHFPDRNPTNNRIENLRWDTRTGNASDAVKHGTFPRGETNGKHVVTKEIVRLIRAAHTTGSTIAALSRKYQVSIGCISHIVHRKNWKHVP